VHPQFYFTHQQILQCTALLPRAHGIETEAAIRDHGNCKKTGEGLWIDSRRHPSWVAAEMAGIGTRHGAIAFFCMELQALQNM
jgi:hypothetical protein